MKGLIVFFKLVALTGLLNLVRYYTVPFVLEPLVIFPGLSGAMEQSSAYFNLNFTAQEWAMSYFYNFTMWFAFTVLYYFLQGSLSGGHVARSLKAYGMFFLIFASISFIYMNHYSHPKSFYLWNVLDAAIVMPVVAIANRSEERRVGKECRL